MIERSTLSNGITVLYLCTPQDPIAACHLFIPNGSARDHEEKEGITTLHWALFLKGTKNKTGRQLAEEIEMLGASLGAGTTHDYSEISCHAPSDQMNDALKLMAECLFTPVFIDEEIAKEKTALQAAIRAKKESVFTVTHEELSHHLYPSHPYGRSTGGREEKVARLVAPDLFSRHTELLQTKGAILAMASNVPFKTMLPHFESLFGNAAWNAAGPPLPELKLASSPSESAEYKCESDFEQAYLMLGFPAAAVGSKDYLPLKVLNGILGGGMSTRLFQTLREKEGLAYDVGSFYATKKYGSAFVVHMGLQASRLSEAKDGIIRELKKIQEEQVPAEELSQVKNQLKGGFILDHQTNSHRAHYLGWWEILGLGAEFDRVYPEAINTVTAAEIHKAAQTYFSGPCITVETVPKQKTPQMLAASHA